MHVMVFNGPPYEQGKSARKSHTVGIQSNQGVTTMAERGIGSQILVALVIAIVAGGSSPWWWGEVKGWLHGGSSDRPPATIPAPGVGDLEQQAISDSDAIQQLYNRHKKTTDCMINRQLVAGIQAYIGNRLPLPDKLSGTILFPAAKANPTVSDLAADRIQRIKDVRSACF